MTIRSVVVCNGNWPGKRCRAYLPVAAATIGKARQMAAVQHWSYYAGADFCPACTRRRASAAKAAQ